MFVSSSDLSQTLRFPIPDPKDLELVQVSLVDVPRDCLCAMNNTVKVLHQCYPGSVDPV